MIKKVLKIGIEKAMKKFAKVCTSVMKFVRAAN